MFVGVNKEEEEGGEGKMVKEVFRGRILSSSFESGDRIVVGDWEDSPLGGFTNVMWADSDGNRTLLSPSSEHSEYVSSLYSFENVKVVPVSVERGPRTISVNADELSVSMSWGPSFPLLFPRPLWFISTVENFFARLIFGTRTHGFANDGSEEWYSVRRIAWLNGATATVLGEEAGRMSRRIKSACFGFSEPPARPAAVTLSSIIKK